MKHLTDEHYMAMALSLARRGLGATWPNPTVGCIIVDQDGHVIGRGYTGEGGRPHGEIIALKQAGPFAEGSTVYVTLEPCAHHGKTSPCAEALVQAKVGRVVIATGDPDARVSGKGIDILSQSEIQVDFGTGKSAADAINSGFFKRIIENKPLVTVKIASSLDGRIASKTGQSKWITGQESRLRGHMLRATHDVIMVGIGTVLADNPSLDCRVSGLEKCSPIRLVLDRQLRIPLDSILVETANTIPTWIATSADENDKRQALEHKGVKIISCLADREESLNLKYLLEKLSEMGVTRVLSEGGSQLNASLIRASLVDRLYWFRSSGIIGGDGLPALQSIGIDELKDMPNLELIRTGRTGNDNWQEFEIGR